MQTKIDKYFESKGIKTIFNCLGNNEKLVRAYVGNFRLDADSHKSHNSQHTKVNTYNKMWTIQPRHKMTGFENLKAQDSILRNSLSKYIFESQHSPLFLVKNDEHDIKLNYKHELIDFVKNIENPLLYLSGGVDSELVACAMIEAGIRFNVVIFEWINNGNHIINGSEIFYAYKFCKNHGIIPTIKQVNIEKLWESEYFKRLSIETQIQSPHLVTYVHAVKAMSVEYSNATHVFGGEVKFKSNYKLDNGEDSNLVWLDKLLPAYNGNQYIDYAGNGQSAYARLVYWGASAFGGNQAGKYFISLQSFPNPVEEGLWTDTPSVLYEERVTYWVYSEGLAGTIGVTPAVAPSDWQIIPNTGFPPLNLPCEVNCSAASYGSYNYGLVTFEIEVRVVGETTPVQASSISLGVYTATF